MGKVISKIRVLLADDHALFREGLRRILEAEADIECVGVAQNGEEAIRLIEELAPDVAIVDIAMPKVSGIEVAKRIKTTLPKTAILMLSAYKHDGYVIACMRAGVNGYLLKDMSPGELTNAIRVASVGEGVFNLEATSAVLRRAFAIDNRNTPVPTDLHRRELEILKMLARGMTNRQIASELALSVHTVRTHLGNVFKKLGVSSRTEALACAAKHGWVEFEALESQ